MDDDREGEVVHEGWLIKSPPLETKTRQIFSQTLIQPVCIRYIMCLCLCPGPVSQNVKSLSVMNGLNLYRLNT